MLAEQIRSGLSETQHAGAVAVVDRSGELIARFGDIDRPFFIRSSAKPFQALVSQEAGAGLEPLELAMACASHRGFPAHIGLVRSVLERGGLNEDDLGCPASWPLAPRAARLVVRDGAESEKSIWHNCSGKHAAFLRACVARGWSVADYLDPEHPLQLQVVSLLSELSEMDVGPVGVDGCGAPVVRTTVRTIARMYARLAADARLAEVYEVMHRYPALVGANGEGDTEIAIAVDGVAKGGAAGCLGVGVRDRFGLAAKSWDGLGDLANLAAVAALDQLGVLSGTARDSLEPIGRPPVLGGGRAVGRFEPRFELEVL